MPRPRLVTLEEKCEWMRKRQAEKAAAAPPSDASADDPPRPVKEKRAKPEVPARFIMYTVAEVAEMFGVSADSIRLWFEDCCAVVGERTSTRAHRRRRMFLISQQDIDDFLARHRS